MSLFSLDNILLNESTENSSIDIDDIGYADTELNNHSFIQEGYNFILEMGRDYIDAEKVFYSNVLGSYGDNEIITESFSSFFDKIKAIIRKFIDWIKKVFKQFIVKINALVSSEKYIKKNHKLLNKFDSEDEFEFKGYEFSKIDDSNIPLGQAYESMFASENDGKGYLSGTAGTSWYASGHDENNADEQTRQTSTLNATLDTSLRNLEDNLEDFYDSFRGKVIGKADTKIDSSDFAEELFRLFRSDDDTPSDITIDSTYVSKAYHRFSNHKDTIKSIEKVQKEIIKDYEALEKYLDKMLKLNKADGKMTMSVAGDSSNDYVKNQIDTLGGRELNDKRVYSSTTYDKMNNYLKRQSAKVSQMCSIHTQAFSAKLEAAKDQFKQDKKILYKALQIIVKNHSKSN